MIKLDKQPSVKRQLLRAVISHGAAIEHLDACSISSLNIAISDQLPQLQPQRVLSSGQPRHEPQAICAFA